MSDKAEKKPDAAKDAKKDAEAKPAAPAAAGGGGLMTKLPVLIGAAMILEAIVLFAGFKFIGGGAKPANGADLTTESKKTEGGEGKTAEAADKTGSVELPLLSSKFPNKKSGKQFLYDVTIVVSVKAINQEKVKKTITDRDALIKDRVSTIIAQSEPDKLGGGSEPGLETLKRQVKYQLDEIAGEGMIDEVLVPTCIGFPVNF